MSREQGAGSKEQGAYAAAGWSPMPRGTYGRAAIDANAGEGAGNGLDLSRDLLGELTCRGHHEGERRTPVAASNTFASSSSVPLASSAIPLASIARAAKRKDALDQRQCKRQRLAHAGARAADAILLSIEEKIKRRRLDGKERLHSASLQRCNRRSAEGVCRPA